MKSIGILLALALSCSFVSAGELVLDLRDIGVAAASSPLLDSPDHWTREKAREKIDEVVSHLNTIKKIKLAKLKRASDQGDREDLAEDIAEIDSALKAIKTAQKN